MSISREDLEQIRTEIKASFLGLWEETVRPLMADLSTQQSRHKEQLHGRITETIGQLYGKINGVEREIATHEARNLGSAHGGRDELKAACKEACREAHIENGFTNGKKEKKTGLEIAVSVFHLIIGSIAVLAFLKAWILSGH